jgi:hypothetical protein
MRAGQSVKWVRKSIRTRLKVPTDTPTRDRYGPGPPRLSASAPGYRRDALHVGPVLLDEDDLLAERCQQRPSRRPPPGRVGWIDDQCRQRTSSRATLTFARVSTGTPGNPPKG